MNFIKRIDKRWLFACAIVIALLILLLASSSTSENQSTNGAQDSNSTVAVDDEFRYRSEDGDISGQIKVASVYEDGLTSFDFAFVVHHDVPNNGFCQSNDPDYCQRANSQTIEEIKYRYGATFSSTESSDNLVAAVYAPIYCNLDEAKADPLNIGYDKIDVTCDGWKVLNWEPTNWFVVKNRSSTRNFSELLSGITLNIYDISEEFVVEVDDGTITTNRFDYDQILGKEQVGSFSLSPVVN